MKKNKVWFEKFEKKLYDDIFYVESNHVYYDLLVLVETDDENLPRFSALPVPIFAEKLGIKITNDLTDIESNWIKCDVLEYFTEIKRISKEKYYEEIDKIKMIKESRKKFPGLSDEEKEILLLFENGIKEYTTNLFGEKVVTDEYWGSAESGFYHRYLACWSSEDLGMGICHCVSHSTYEERPVPLDVVLEVGKEILEKQSN